jgi:ABC-type transporter Mla subunit MlaD
VVRVPSVSEIVGAIQAQTEALAELPATMASLTRAVRNLARAFEETGDTLAAVQRLVVRVDRIVGELEEPVAALSPGLTRLARMLDSDLVELLPDTLRQLQETQRRMAAMAATTERITSLMDETGARLGMLPGAGFLRGLRPSPRPGDDEQ